MRVCVCVRGVALGSFNSTTAPEADNDTGVGDPELSFHARTHRHTQRNVFPLRRESIFVLFSFLSLSLSLSDILNLQKGLPAHEFIIYVFTLAEGLHHGVDVQ